MRQTFLPFSLPLIGEEEKKEVLDTLDSGWITTGPKTQRFEEGFKEYIGCKYTIAVNSCTAALHLSLAALGIGPGDEVIIPTFTFAATANVAIHVGARPVLVDIKPDTFNIDPQQIESYLTKKLSTDKRQSSTCPKAIIPVHYAGQPCDMGKIWSIADKYNLRVIEDAAHAVGAEYQSDEGGVRSKREKIGSGHLSDTACFSFYPIKNMTTGEGGMITTDKEDLAERIRVYSLHGISKDAWRRYEAKNSWYYEITYAGYKYNMTDIQAALGIHQLARLENFLSKREEYAQIYNQAFAEFPEIIIPYVKDSIRHARHLYPILINNNLMKISRDQFIEELRAQNIGTSVHFIPLHLHPYFQDTFGYQRGDFPIAEHVFDRIISLPLYPKMTREDIEDVIRAVIEIINTNRYE